MVAFTEELRTEGSAEVMIWIIYDRESSDDDDEPSGAGGRMVLHTMIYSHRSLAPIQHSMFKERCIRVGRTERSKVHVQSGRQQGRR
jgi:hypothetical protein